MEAEASAFETSEMVAIFLASTPLVRESWRLCEAASFSPMGIVIEQKGDVGYLAFSSIQTGQAIADPNWARLVPLEIAGDVVFGPLLSRRDGDVDTDCDGDRQPVMIHAGLLELFLSLFRSQNLQHQILSLKEQCKSIVITGHSLGGAIASLSTLWLLCHCHLQSVSYSPSVLCITFGSPLLGNESLSRAILRERWGGNFCHVVSKHDIMPRLLLAPSATVTPQMQLLLQHWHLSMGTTTTAPHFGSHQNVAAAQLGDPEKAEFFGLIMACLNNSSSEEALKNLLFWPFGNYLLCSKDGAICLDNAASVIKMMHLMFMTGSPNDCIEDHLKYGEYVGRGSSQYLKRFVQMQPSESCYEAGLALALHSSGIPSQEPAVSSAKDCLTNARRVGRRMPEITCANLAVKLSKIVPFRAEIEWYKASCDESSDQMGYYDAFKRRGSSKKGNQVDMNRRKLAGFWDNVIDLWESNQLPYDFHKRAKWVNAFHSYKLIVEPLDIGEYYRKDMHIHNGHYLRNGRPRRFQISDRWWKERRKNEKDNDARTTLASATQDSCFWARLEEAMELLANLQSENEEVKKETWVNINKFNEYARRLVERKEVSKDVLAKNSSYTKWTKDLEKLSSPLVFPVTPFPEFPQMKF
ncbi:hypothetical protein CsatB_023204 [Cannabis sativa]